jgi:hypothetical protein
MEKRLCLTTLFSALPACGMGEVCLLDVFTPFYGFFHRFCLSPKDFSALFYPFKGKHDFCFRL